MIYYIKPPIKNFCATLLFYSSRCKIIVLFFSLPFFILPFLHMMRTPLYKVSYALRTKSMLPLSTHVFFFFKDFPH